jgi:tetratricopeptide (TPR) repeat protein
VGSAVGAQTTADFIAAGDRDNAALNATSALKHYQEALALDSTNYDALCKAAYESVSLGEFDPSPDARAALYKSGEQYARRAVAANPKGADGHFQLARAVGRMALTMGMTDQVKYGGTEVHNEAMAALTIDPKHAGALDVLGVWNEKVMQLNWASRTIARTILGGHVMGEASWETAQRDLEEAVAIEPNRIIHHLDLGRVYADRGDKVRARAQFEWIQAAPVVDYDDPNYKRQAADALKELGPAQSSR